MVAKGPLSPAPVPSMPMHAVQARPVARRRRADCNVCAASRSLRLLLAPLLLVFIPRRQLRRGNQVFPRTFSLIRAGTRSGPTPGPCSHLSLDFNSSPARPAEVLAVLLAGPQRTVATCKESRINVGRGLFFKGGVRPGNPSAASLFGVW